MVITFGRKHFLLFPYPYYDTLLPDESIPSSMVFYDQIQDQLDFILYVFYLLLSKSRTEVVPLPAVSGNLSFMTSSHPLNASPG